MGFCVFVQKSKKVFLKNLARFVECLDFAQLLAKFRSIYLA